MSSGLYIGIKTTRYGRQYKEREQSLRHYITLMEIFNGAKKIAYAKIFRDNILTYNASGVSIDKEEIEKFQKEYVKLVFRCCGPHITQDLVNIFGDMESISIMLINEFIGRVTQDELSFSDLEKSLRDDTDIIE